jgi:Zn-dependent protease with chaperone function
MLLCDALWRASRSWRRTKVVMQEWQRTAAPLMLRGWRGPAWVIRPIFPVVAVVGAWRPQLFIAEQVIDCCTPAELASIAAHEAAHVAARDNLIRLLFAMTPGTRLFAPLATDLERMWAGAAEEAADIAATKVTSRVELASALTKVARLAPGLREPLVASALISVSDLESRVRRLLNASSPQPFQKNVWLPAALLLSAFVAAQLPAPARTLHELFELLVRSY